MLIRIVNMTFHPDRAKDFLVVFENAKDRIKSSPGCLHLELLRDYNAENCFTTYSHWVDEEALNTYRESDVFKEIWEQTKELFVERPHVSSLKKFIRVG